MRDRRETEQDDPRPRAKPCGSDQGTERIVLDGVGPVNSIPTKEIVEGDGSDPYDVMGQEAHPAGDDVAEDALTTTTEESTMTTDTDPTSEKPLSLGVSPKAISAARAASAAKPARAAVQSAALRKANEARSTAAAAKRAEKAAEEAKADRAKARGANRAEIVKRHGKNESVATIATALGISQNRVRQILQDSGLVKRESRHPERDARIIAAIDAGEKPAIVAEREGLKEFRVRWIHKVAKAGSA